MQIFTQAESQSTCTETKTSKLLDVTLAPVHSMTNRGKCFQERNMSLINNYRSVSIVHGRPWLAFFREDRYLFPSREVREVWEETQIWDKTIFIYPRKTCNIIQHYDIKLTVMCVFFTELTKLFCRLDKILSFGQN